MRQPSQRNANCHKPVSNDSLHSKAKNRAMVGHIQSPGRNASRLAPSRDELWGFKTPRFTSKFEIGLNWRPTWTTTTMIASSVPTQNAVLCSGVFTRRTMKRRTRTRTRTRTRSPMRLVTCFENESGPIVRALLVGLQALVAGQQQEQPASRSAQQ